MATMPRLADADIPQDTTALSVMPDPATEKDEQGGFFARLFPKAAEAARNGDANVTDRTGNDQKLPPEAFGVKSDVSQDTGNPGSVASRTVPTVGRSVVLPYGKIARVCDMPKRALGKKVAQHPEKRRRYVLHDSDPGNTAPHTFYLTGFDDGCARQFTASVAIFGSVGMHEQLRYGLPADVQPYSDTDKAYEKLKSRVCGVRRKKPCGSKIGRLENDTVFLSIYENFGGNQRWSNLLLHSGRVLAQDIKG